MRDRRAGLLMVGTHLFLAAAVALPITQGVARGLEPCLPPDAIGARNAHAMVYDADLNRTILFGGADECQVRGDTWAWDGATWSLLTTEGPRPRTFAAAAYDARRRQVVLFGGNEVLFGIAPEPKTFLRDTWVLEKDRWSERKVDGPGPRAEAAMAYDESRKRIVLFGGYRLDDRSEKVRLGDTWEWDAREWHEVDGGEPGGPSARNGASLAYSPAERGVVLFGGSGASGETWLWNGNRWRRLLQDAALPGRFNTAMAFDEVTGHLVRFGGWDGQRRVDDTWTLNETWVLIETRGPSARNHATMVLDAARKRLVLFGGHDGELIFADTWEWDGAEWLLVAPGDAKRRIDNGH